MAGDTKWSPEPWRVTEDGSIKDAQDRTIAWVSDFRHQSSDPRRFVACVNFCAGVPTEALESGVSAVNNAPVFVCVCDAKPCACEGGR